jgi:hypothetical protein
MDIELNKKWIAGCYKHYLKNVEFDTNYWNKWMIGCLNKFKENENKNSTTSTEDKGWSIDLETVLFSLNRGI